MSNPTTPFGWQMPTNTDLVTDLPADFEVFGQAVATSMGDLLGGTTGQYLAKNSATDMDFIWVTDAAGDITGVTAGTGISGGGTSGTVTVTNSMATAITTNGDLIYGTGSGTFNRLGIGTTGQVLTVAGGIPSYATPASGSMTLLSTTTLSGASTTISSISGSYKDLRIEIRGVNVAAAAYPTLAPNGSTSISTTLNVGYDDQVGVISSYYAANSIRPTNNRDLTAGVTTNTFEITILNYASVVSNKNIIGSVWTKMTGREMVFGIFGVVNTTSAITSLVFGLSASTYSGGTVLLYGVN